jgi:hypothetical protein
MKIVLLNGMMGATASTQEVGCKMPVVVINQWLLFLD